MLKNINYDLLETITIISKSLYRYDAYIENASESRECQEIWRHLKGARERDLQILLNELKRQVETGVFPL